MTEHYEVFVSHCDWTEWKTQRKWMSVYLIYVFVCKEDSNVAWKHESTVPLLQRFPKSYRKKQSIQFVTFFKKKKSLKNIIQFRMTVLKKKSVYFYIFLLWHSHWSGVSFELFLMEADPWPSFFLSSKCVFKMHNFCKLLGFLLLLLFSMLVPDVSLQTWISKKAEEYKEKV